MNTSSIIMSLLIVSVLAIGCFTNANQSVKWKSAESVVKAFEHEYTNGMIWPSGVSSIENVMNPGMTISVTSGDQRLSITAKTNYERIYTWDGEPRSVHLKPRSTRWFGSLGLYFPGEGKHWRSNNGITRGVLEEGYLWFTNVEAALSWLNKMQPLKNCVYSSTGLVVAWEKNLRREQITVSVWQIMVSGNKPDALLGATDDLIVVSFIGVKS